MTLQEIYNSSRNLASQFRGGISMHEAVSTMAGAQPAYEQFWEESAVQVEAGNSLSTVLAKVWPESLVSAVVAGEESGSMVEVFSRIAKTTEIQLGIRKSFMRLVQPVSISLIAVLVFICMMVFLVPMITRSFASKHMKPSGLVALALQMESFFLKYWLVVFAAIGAGIFIFWRWVNTEEGKNAVLEWALGLPVLGDGLRLIFYGAWADYLGLMYGAGIPIERSMNLSMGIVPVSMRTGFELFVNDITVNSVSLSDAVNPARLAKVDPQDARLEWPLFIRNAMRVGDKTGLIDKELALISPELTESGVDVVNRFVAKANLMSIVLAIVLVGMCYMAIYMPMFQSMQRLR